MPISQADLEKRIAALRKARDSGVLTVRHGDTSTEFRSLSEMNQIIADLERQHGAMLGLNRSKVRYVRQTGKGL